MSQCCLCMLISSRQKDSIAIRSNHYIHVWRFRGGWRKREIKKDYVEKKRKIKQKGASSKSVQYFSKHKNFKLFAFILLFKGSHYSELTHPVVIKGGNQDV